MNGRLLRGGLTRWWWLLLIGAGMPAFAADEAATDTLTPDRIARLRSVAEVAVSPEGGRVKGPGGPLPGPDLDYALPAVGN